MTFLIKNDITLRNLKENLYIYNGLKQFFGIFQHRLIENMKSVLKNDITL